MENASRCPCFGGRCVGTLKSPPECFVDCCDPVRQPAPSATPHPRVALPSARSIAMSARTTYPNLRRLVGESADQLPADIAERIEDVLSEPSDLLPALMA